MTNATRRAELQAEAARTRAVAEAHKGTPLFASKDRQAQIAQWKLEAFEQGGTATHEGTQSIQTAND